MPIAFIVAAWLDYRRRKNAESDDEDEGGGWRNHGSSPPADKPPSGDGDFPRRTVEEILANCIAGNRESEPVVIPEGVCA